MKVWRIRGTCRTALLAAALATGCGSIEKEHEPPRAVSWEQYQVVDLTHTFDGSTVYWPTGKPFEHRRTAWGRTEQGYFYSAFDYAASEHLGTHIDAPIHFAEAKRAVDQIPPEQLLGEAVVIDIAEACAGNADYLLSVADIEAHERRHGSIPRQSIVLVRTGWSRYWPHTGQYLGDDTPGAVANLHFPGIGPGAAQALVDRGVAAAGIDTASIDHGPSQDFPSHQILAAAQIPGLENLARLDAVPSRGASIIALPMKIGGGSGAPLRIVALIAPSRP